MSNVSSGKAFERRIADIMGGVHQEKAHYGDSTHDVETSDFIVECKLRKGLTIETWMQQAEAYKKDDKICVVVAKEKGLPADKALIIMRLKDFKRLAGTD
jgi:hypothetical protein